MNRKMFEFSLEWQTKEKKSLRLKYINVKKVISSFQNQMENKINPDKNNNTLWCWC